MKTESAKAAAIIKAELKKHGIKASVRSRNFSMGDAVDITVYDQLPAVFKKIEEFSGQFQYGSFNGMEDIYEYTNSRKDIPQAKYVHVRNEYSDELRQKAWSFIREYYGYDDQPEDVKEASRIYLSKHCEWADTIIYRTLRNEGAFWTANKPRVRVEA
jgi:hypothetical protein